MVKYSKNFEKDYNWYLKYKDIFNFSGSLDSKGLVIKDKNGLTAKECFYYRDSQGIVKYTKEPELLSQIYKCKESINFHIKMWAESIAEGTLPLIEFNNTEDNELRVLEWINQEPVYIKDIKTQYELLDWMIEAVENQKYKYYKNE